MLRPLQALNASEGATSAGAAAASHSASATSLKLVTEAMQDGRRFLAVAIEVHVLRLRVINEVRLVLHNETLERRRMLHQQDREPPMAHLHGIPKASPLLLLVPREARVEIASVVKLWRLPVCPSKAA